MFVPFTFTVAVVFAVTFAFAVAIFAFTAVVREWSHRAKSDCSRRKNRFHAFTESGSLFFLVFVIVDDG